MPMYQTPCEPTSVHASKKSLGVFFKQKKGGASSGVKCLKFRHGWKEIHSYIIFTTCNDILIPQVKSGYLLGNF